MSFRQLRGADFYVAVNGTANGDGSVARPWNLATALAQPASVRPGDTIWLRGGVYTFPAGTNILCGLRGTAEAPITVAQVPGERATIDIKGSAQGIFFTTSPKAAGAAYVHFKDFEVTNSDANRTPGMPAGIYVRTSDHLKFINLVVHDTAEGFALAPEATNTEVYGSLVYYNGALSGQEHGIYVQNVAGFKKIIDNVIFANAGYGIHAFPHATDSSLLDVALVGNISFNNGLLGGLQAQPDLLLGGDSVAIFPTISNNWTFKTPAGTLWNQQIGYSAGCKSPSITNNYFVGATLLTACRNDAVMNGNTFIGTLLNRVSPSSPITELVPADSLGNVFMNTAPLEPKVRLRRNFYETGRAQVGIYAWGGRTELSLDASDVLAPGDRYELRAAENYFGRPVATGLFDGRPINVSLQAQTPAQPVGFASSPGLDSTLAAFILRVTAPGPSCLPPYGLPLSPNSSFCAQLLVRDPSSGETVRGEATAENNLFGYFSIPALTGDRSNPEVFVKLLDGRSLNGKFWAFFGGLTDLEYNLTVIDRNTGEKRSWVKLAGSACGGFDTGAFPTGAPSPILLSKRMDASGRVLDSIQRPSSASSPLLSLIPAHPFEVSLTATDPRSGTVAQGVAISRNGVFGYFALPDLTGDPGNAEVFVKILDATSFDGKYWVFYGGLTDLEYTITVREVSTGRTQTYFKPGGSACGGFDTSAF